MEERIARAIALQVWRLSRCPHYCRQDGFVDNFSHLVEQQDQVATWLSTCETFKAVA